MEGDSELTATIASIARKRRLLRGATGNARLSLAAKGRFDVCKPRLPDGRLGVLTGGRGAPGPSRFTSARRLVSDPFGDSLFPATSSF